jgi:nitroreductase
MDVKDAISARRSIRKYLDKDVPDDIVREVIDAARLAPSGNNAQPSRYYAVRDSSRLQGIIRDGWAYSAPVIIVCAADPLAYPKFVEGWDDPNEVRALRDLPIASSYLVLRAQELSWHLLLRLDKEGGDKGSP